MIVKMTILRLLGSSDDKEKISVARPEGPPLRWSRGQGGRGGAAPRGSQGSALKPLRSKGQRIEETVKKSSQNKQDRDILLSPVKPMMSKLYSPVQWTQKLRLGFCVGWTDDEDIEYVGATAEEDQGNCIHRLNRWYTGQLRRCSCPESWFSRTLGQLHAPVRPAMKMHSPVDYVGWLRYPFKYNG